MKTIYITDPDATDVNTFTSQLSNYLTADIAFEIKLVSTNPYIKLSLIYDETSIDEENLLQNLAAGEYVVENA